MSPNIPVYANHCRVVRLLKSELQDRDMQIKSLRAFARNEAFAKWEMQKEAERRVNSNSQLQAEHESLKKEKLAADTVLKATRKALAEATKCCQSGFLARTGDWLASKEWGRVLKCVGSCIF